MKVHQLNQASDLVFGGPRLQNATLSDFWRWAFSDLCDDDIKGFFAEWLVHKLLGIESRRRVSWANNDVVTPEGISIEVKSTAYWQSWKVIDEHGNPLDKPKREPPHESKIRFGGLTARDSTDVVDMGSERQLKSDLYVFMFQHEKDIARWNAMDLSQWEFYVLRANHLSQLVTGRTISLSKLRSVQKPLNAEEFVSSASHLMKSMERGRNAV